MILRLDPTIPLVWRSPTSLQLGVERVVARLDDLSPDDERMLDALRRGTSRGAITLIGGGPVPADALVERLSSALASPPPTRGTYRVHGTGALATAVATLLGGAARRAEDGTDPDLAVLVTDWVVSPADAGAWLRRDIRHLPVVAADGVVTVGPLVAPGDGPCLHCVGLARRDGDAAWPAIASQLLDRAPPALDPVSLAAAAALAARRALDALDGIVAAPGGAPHPRPPAATSWTLTTGTGEVTSREWRTHRECRCSAQPGSDWAAGDPIGPS